MNQDFAPEFMAGDTTLEAVSDFKYLADGCLPLTAMQWQLPRTLRKHASNEASYAAY